MCNFWGKYCPVISSIWSMCIGPTRRSTTSRPEIFLCLMYAQLCGPSGSGRLRQCPALSLVSGRSARASYPFDFGRCPRAARLPVVRDREPTTDHFGPSVIGGCRIWPGTRLTGLCTGFDDHRSVPLVLSLGRLLAEQGRHQSACAALYASGASCVRQPGYWQGALCANHGS